MNRRATHRYALLRVRQILACAIVLKQVAKVPVPLWLSHRVGSGQTASVSLLFHRECGCLQTVQCDRRTASNAKAKIARNRRKSIYAICQAAANRRTEARSIAPSVKPSTIIFDDGGVRHRTPPSHT
jgi:hypothetical protein